MKVFQMNSRGFNVILNITEYDEPPNLDRVAKEYLGKEIFVSWPHLFEAKVISVSDSVNRSVNELLLSCTVLPSKHQYKV